MAGRCRGRDRAGGPSAQPVGPLPGVGPVEAAPFDEVAAEGVPGDRPVTAAGRPTHGGLPPPGDPDQRSRGHHPMERGERDVPVDAAGADPPLVDARMLQEHRGRDGDGARVGRGGQACEELFHIDALVGVHELPPFWVGRGVRRRRLSLGGADDVQSDRRPGTPFSQITVLPITPAVRLDSTDTYVHCRHRGPSNGKHRSDPGSGRCGPARGEVREPREPRRSEDRRGSRASATVALSWGSAVGRTTVVGRVDRRTDQAVRRVRGRP
ncbi:hypothetical protein SDC9_67219 [bioreactor metagenome]|uniref:Uncharacterized protein n=1 Tax=bioreactor metagenome TaxID=1076179 RepID=A0A644Y2N6_9ZZZZ